MKRIAALAVALVLSGCTITPAPDETGYIAAMQDKYAHTPQEDLLKVGYTMCDLMAEEEMSTKELVMALMLTNTEERALVMADATYAAETHLCP